MAKMFYTIEEAAEYLGTTADDVQGKIDGGTLPSFDDEGTTMVKISDLEELGDKVTIDDEGLGDGSSAAATIGISIMSDDEAGDDAADSAAATLPSSSPDDLLDDLSSGSGFDLDVSSDDDAESSDSEGSGISIFSEDEVGDSDDMAATQVTDSPIDDEDLALESVGSGSGLLDLTRESDDTSLGAELLDEIYPDEGDDTDDIKVDTAAVGATGIFDSDMASQANDLAEGSVGESFLDDSFSADTSPATDTGFDSGASFEQTDTSFGLDSSPEASGSGFGLDGASAEPAGDIGNIRAAPMAAVQVIEYDPVGSYFGSGWLIGAFAACIVGLFVMIPTIPGVPGSMTNMLYQIDPGTNKLLVEPNGARNLFIFAGVVVVVSLILSIIGLLVGRKKENK